jgi:hypothetical protein
MHLKLPVVLLSAFALAAPGATAFGKDRKGGDDNRDHRDGDRDGKITICHIPPGNRSARHTISVSESAWAAHQGHGDHRGACGRGAPRPRGFNDLDINHDHVLTFEEFRGDRVTFDRLDRDHDHLLTPDEFHRR